MLSVNSVTAVTNFLLSGESLFLCGLYWARPKQAYSAAWFWQLALLWLSVTAFLGGVYHGFLQDTNMLAAADLLEDVNWFFIGLLTFCILVTTSREFLDDRYQPYAYGAGVLQLTLYTVMLARVESFLLVIVNYVPVMLWMLVMSLAYSGRRKGSWALAAGIALGFIGSGVQASGLDVLSPLDKNGLYHLVMMVSVVFLYRGGLYMKGMHGEENLIAGVENGNQDQTGI